MLDAPLSIHKVLKDWRSITKAITKSAEEVLGDVEVIPFGSITKGEAVIASDFDILIVASHLPASAWNRAQIKSKIEEAAGLPPLHPIQIHLTSKKEVNANPIYKEVLDQFRTSQ